MPLGSMESCRVRKSRADEFEDFLTYLEFLDKSTIGVIVEVVALGVFI